METSAAGLLFAQKNRRTAAAINPMGHAAGATFYRATSPLPGQGQCQGPDSAKHNSVLSPIIPCNRLFLDTPRLRDRAEFPTSARCNIPAEFRYNAGHAGR